MGRVSLRRETIFRDWAISLSSYKDFWIVSSSSRVASSLSIRRLIVCGNLLDRRMVRDITLLSAESRYASCHTRNEIFQHRVGSANVYQMVCQEHQQVNRIDDNIADYTCAVERRWSTAGESPARELGSLHPEVIGAAVKETKPSEPPV